MEIVTERPKKTYPYLAQASITPIGTEGIGIISKRENGRLWWQPLEGEMAGWEITSESDYERLPIGSKVTITQ